MAGKEGFGGVADVVGGGLPLSRVTADSTALMIIDMQYVDAPRDYGIGAAGQRHGWTDDMEYYFSRLETVAIPNGPILREMWRQPMRLT